MSVSNVTYAGVDVLSAETILNPVMAVDDGSKGKSIVRSPEVVTFLFFIRYGAYPYACGFDLIGSIYSHSGINSQSEIALFFLMGVILIAVVKVVMCSRGGLSL